MYQLKKLKLGDFTRLFPFCSLLTLIIHFLILLTRGKGGREIPLPTQTFFDQQQMMIQVEQHLHG